MVRNRRNSLVQRWSFASPPSLVPEGSILAGIDRARVRGTGRVHCDFDMDRRYALVVGQGRSGTNWLLEILDHSHTTFVRNEPEGIQGSLLAALMGDKVSFPAVASFGESWDRAVESACSVIGVRDHRIRVSKFYLYEVVRRFGGIRIASSLRLRKSLARVLPGFRAEEWRIPWWLGSAERQAQALGILKVNHPGWVRWVLSKRPEVPVLHIVRHPGGFLNSWINRYLALNDPERVRRENADRLRRIAAADETWSTRFGDIDAMSVEESELWYWMSSAETTYLIGRERERFHQFVYEEVVRDVLDNARRAYAACSLEWTKAVEQEVLRGARDSRSIADKWRQQLTPSQMALVDRILEQTRIGSWWKS